MAIVPDLPVTIAGPSAQGVITPVTTLNAATTGNGDAADFGAATRTSTSLVIIANGTITGGVVDLQVSHDGTNWVKISSSATLGTGVNQHLTLGGGAFRYARGAVSSEVTGGGSVTATLMSS